MLSSKYSFRLISEPEEVKKTSLGLSLVANDIIRADVDDISKNEGNFEDFYEEEGGEDKGDKVDDKKRNFLKALGVVGVGAVAASIFPSKADALVFGSTPTSNTVGVKNASNVKINPATQETLASIKSQSDLLTFDSGSNPANLKVNVAAGVVGIKNASSSPINPATEETLANLATGNGVIKMSINLSASGTVRTPSSGKKIRVYASRFSLTADAAYVSFRFTPGGTDHEKYVSPKTGGLYGSNNHPNFVEGGVDEVLYCDISGTTTVQINIDYLEV